MLEGFEVPESKFVSKNLLTLEAFYYIANHNIFETVLRKELLLGEAVHSSLFDLKISLSYE